MPPVNRQGFVAPQRRPEVGVVVLLLLDAALVPLEGAVFVAGVACTTAEAEEAREGWQLGQVKREEDESQGQGSEKGAGRNGNAQQRHIVMNSKEWLHGEEGRKIQGRKGRKGEEKDKSGIENKEQEM